jgi:hypothetical protein
VEVLLEMFRFAVVLLIALSSAVASAKELSPSAKIEIEGLLHALGASQCEFYRNGSWYSGTKAEDHLRSKLDYLVKKEQLSTTEEFILEAATQSSFSGKSYQVRCPSQDPVPSADWLEIQLKRLRSEGPKQ